MTKKNENITEIPEFDTAFDRGCWVVEQHDYYGKTYVELAEMFGVTKQRIQQIYKRTKEEIYGVKKRGKAGRPRKTEGIWKFRKPKYRQVLSIEAKSQRLLDIKDGIENGTSPEILAQKWGITPHYVMKLYGKIQACASERNNQ